MMIFVTEMTVTFLAWNYVKDVKQGYLMTLNVIAVSISKSYTVILWVYISDIAAIGNANLLLMYVTFCGYFIKDNF